MLKKLKFITRDYGPHRQLERKTLTSQVPTGVVARFSNVREMQMECHLFRFTIFPGNGHCPIDS